MKLSMLVALLAVSSVARAQDSTKIAITTGVGVIEVPGKLRMVLKPAVTFNSGLVYRLSENWFVQGDVSLNSIGYDQMTREDNSSFLFKDASSSLFQAAISAGYMFAIKNTALAVSFYAGPGYQRFGEPRIFPDNSTLTATQNILRKSSLLVKTGSRISYQTRSAFLQTIYLEATYFSSPITIQQYRLQGFSYCIGTKFSLM